MVTLVKPEGGLSEVRLREAEKLLGVRFPADYRDFLLEHNGGRPQPATFAIVWNSDQACAAHWQRSEVSRFLAIHDGAKANLLAVNRVDFRGRLPADTIAVAQDPGGNVILLAVEGPLNNRVLFWVKDAEVGDGGVPGFDNVGFVADSFTELLNCKLR